MLQVDQWAQMKDPCQICGTVSKKRPRAGKQRYAHKCPHGAWCVAGSRNGITSNHPALGGPNYCPECVRLGRYGDRGTVFNLLLRTEPWPLETHEVRPCPVCGKRWQPWGGSHLPCHAVCLFTDVAREAIRQDPRCSAVLVQEYGVTVSIIRAVRATRRRAGRAREKECLSCTNAIRGLMARRP